MFNDLELNGWTYYKPLDTIVTLIRCDRTHCTIRAPGEPSKVVPKTDLAHPNSTSAGGKNRWTIKKE